MAQAPDPPRFDAIVLGAGPAGEVAATRLPDLGLETALIERELVGGECAYWACIPSKTLLRPVEVRHEAELAAGTAVPATRWEEVAAYRDYMVRHLDDGDEVEGYERRGVRVFKGTASITGPKEVRVGEELLRGERIVIATGSEPLIPPIEGLAEVGYWTNREATTLSTIPESVIVLGGGPVGVELAQMLRRFGAEVHLLEAADRLLAREDPRVSELLLEALAGDGIDVHLGAEVTSVRRAGEHRVASFNGRELGAHELVVAVGRRPRVGGLSLEQAGIEPGPRGIEVDERCRAGEGIWAVGDVTGQLAFTHVAKYQARIACADIAGDSPHADYAAVPRVVFSDPEVAAVGITEQEARRDGIEVQVVGLRMPDAIARPWTYETEPRGELMLIVERRRGILLGAWAVAPLASEWIHWAALAVKAQIPVAVLSDFVPQFPTYTEAYERALEQLGH